MNAEASGQAVEHEPYHGDVHPGGGTGFGAFVIAHEPTLLHQLGKRALDDPPLRQHHEAGQVVRALDHFHRQPWAVFPDPVR